MTLTYSGTNFIAEGQGFEPWGLLHPLVFKTSAFGHSANLPFPLLSGTALWFIPDLSPENTILPVNRAAADLLVLSHHLHEI